MNKTKEKLEPLFNGLLRNGINPELIAEAPLFQIAVRQYVDGEMSIITILDIAEKINIIGDGKFSEKVIFEA